MAPIFVDYEEISERGLGLCLHAQSNLINIREPLEMESEGEVSESIWNFI